MFPHWVAILIIVFLVCDSIHSNDVPFASHDNTAGIARVGYEEALCHVLRGTHGSFLAIAFTVVLLASGIVMVVKFRFSLSTFLAHLTRNIVVLCSLE